jgi:uncharacterized membrane protein YeaQ/YmgE (transglycosylase-associated protein family)
MMQEGWAAVMVEHMVHMGPMLLLAGLLTAWMAEAISRAGGYGFTWDMALGVAGSVVGGVIIWVAISGEAGMVTMFLIGCGGAALVITAQRSFWRSVQPGT